MKLAQKSTYESKLKDPVDQIEDNSGLLELSTTFNDQPGK